LHAVAPYVTVRSDTFRIRAYGASTDRAGNILAEAWCEAVVQRSPDYVDPSDEAHERDLTPANEIFGRRFRILSFRWLQKDANGELS